MTVGGVEVGIARPLVLALLVPAAFALVLLVFRRRPADSELSRRSRALLFGSRLLVVACLLVAAAGPYTARTQVTPGEPRVTVLVDESNSMALFDAGETVDRLVRGVEAEGVPVSTRVVGSGNDSRVGDGVVAGLEAGGSLLLVSDGRVTGGRSLESAAELARAANVTLSAVDLATNRTDAAVQVFGPSTTSVGVEGEFLVRVRGVGLDPPPSVTVEVDGRRVATEPAGGNGTVEFSHAFESTGSHRIVATLDDGDGGVDAVAENDVARKSVRVVEPPRILYVAREEYPLAELLDGLYDVTRAESVPPTLDPYLAVVVQDVPAGDVGNDTALQEFVLDGGGLVAVGGENAFESGGYEASLYGSLLPVQVGETRGQGRAVVLAIDVSGSTADGMRVQKAVGLDVLDNLGDDNVVGLVAFNERAYAPVDPAPLAENRPAIADAIRRLEAGGGTRIDFGLRGASEMLGDEGGSVILVTDGLDEPADVLPVADRLGEQGTRVLAVGVGEEVDEALLSAVAEGTGGSYLRATETDRLRLLFGDESRRFRGDTLVVVDATHFVTTGVELAADPTRANDVSVREGADLLVATSDGRPAVSAWRYGLGRVVAITAYGADGTLDGLLARPDSLVLSRAVNWAIGDPERGTGGLLPLPDARVGEPTTATYVGPDRPTAPGVRFRQVGEGRYEATLVPEATGFERLLDVEYAVDYPREFDELGVDPALADALRATGGRTFEPDDAAGIAAFARRQATGRREVRTEWDGAFLVAALVVYLVEVAARRLGVYARRRPTA